MTSSGGQLPLERALDTVCAAALLVSVLWLVSVTLLAVVAELARRGAPGTGPATRLDRLVARGCPPAVRRLAATAVGAALVVAAAGPVVANARPGAGRPPVDVVGLAVPERTTGQGLATATPGTMRSRPTRALVVGPGDCLWTLASGLLGPDVSDREITAAWHRLADANADRIGPDPDLILPGTRLRVPDLTTPSRKAAP